MEQQPQTLSADVVSKLTRNSTILAICLAIALVAALVAARSDMSEHHTVVSVDARGVMTAVVPLDNPLLPDSRIIAFTEECLRKSFSHSVLNYPTTITEAGDCFTHNASDLYVAGMAGFLETIKTRKMEMAMTSTRPSRITRLYFKPTYYDPKTVAWDVTANIAIYFEGKNERIPPTPYRVNMTVIRVPLEVTPRGVQIEKFEVGPDSVN
jgi:hypothetical protein